MIAAFRIGGTELMADDGMGEQQAGFKGMTLAIEVADHAQAKRVFTARGEGGSVAMPLMKTFWTSSFGMLTDKFGVPWMVNVAAPNACVGAVELRKASKPESGHGHASVLVQHCWSSEVTIGE